MPVGTGEASHSASQPTHGTVLDNKAYPWWCEASHKNSNHIRLPARLLWGLWRWWHSNGLSHGDMTRSRQHIVMMVRNPISPQGTQLLHCHCLGLPLCTCISTTDTSCLGWGLQPKLEMRLQTLQLTRKLKKPKWEKTSWKPCRHDSNHIDPSHVSTKPSHKGISPGRYQNLYLYLKYKPWFEHHYLSQLLNWFGSVT